MRSGDRKSASASLAALENRFDLAIRTVVDSGHDRGDQMPEGCPPPQLGHGFEPGLWARGVWFGRPPGLFRQRSAPRGSPGRPGPGSSVRRSAGRRAPAVILVRPRPGVGSSSASSTPRVSRYLAFDPLVGRCWCRARPVRASMKVARVRPGPPRGIDRPRSPDRSPGLLKPR